MGRNTDIPFKPNFSALRGWPTGGDAGTYARAENIITSTEVGVHEALDVNVCAGGGTGYYYLDDANDFTLGTDYGNAIMAVFTTDTVDAGDIGVLSMTADRRLRVDANVTALGLQSEYIDDTGFVVAEDYGQAVGGIYTADQVNAGDFGVFKINAHREQGIYLTHNGFDVSVRPTWISATEDETALPLAVSSSCWGYYAAGAVNARMRPHIMDLEDDAVASGQLLQTVIPLNYYYDTTATSWKRWEGSGAPEVNATVTAMPVVEVESPLNTDIKSFDHPDYEVNRIVWQDPVYRGGSKNDTVPAQFRWTIPAGWTNGTYVTNVGVLAPYEGNFCLNIYDNGGVIDYNQLPFFWLGNPWNDTSSYSANKVVVLEGRFHMRDNYDATAHYCFGFQFFDAGWRRMFIIDIHAVAGVYNVYRGTADNASAFVVAANIAEDGWNYFRLECYPPHHGAGANFKSLTINGQPVAIAGLGFYSVATGAFIGMAVKAGTFFADANVTSLWDEFTLWTYYDEYVE